MRAGNQGDGSVLRIYSQMEVFLLTVTVSSKQEKIVSAFVLSSLGVIRLTIGTMIRPAIIAMAPALMGEAINLRNMLDTVKNTPQIKLAQTAAFVTPFQYGNHCCTRYASGILLILGKIQTGVICSYQNQASVYTDIGHGFRHWGFRNMQRTPLHLLHMLLWRLPHCPALSLLHSFLSSVNLNFDLQSICLHHTVRAILVSQSYLLDFLEYPQI